MPRIDVRRYRNPKGTGFKGSLEPEDLSWVVFVRNDGAVMAFNRDSRTGAVVGEPAILK